MTTINHIGAVVFVITGSPENPHRRPIEPGSFDAAGDWISADISSEDTGIQAYAAELWTAEVVAAYRDELLAMT